MRNKILKKILKDLESAKYVIVKSFSLNENVYGKDIDIYCYSNYHIRNKIIKAFSDLDLNKHFLIEVKEQSHQSHIDIKENDSLVLRFDLYDNLPKFKKLNVRESLFDVVIETRELVNNNEINYFIASKNFNNLLRYIEYIEYFQIENNKIKHLDFLEKNLSSDTNFFENIHYYIKFKYEMPKNKKWLNKEDVSLLFKKVKETPISKLPKKIFTFLFK